MEEGCEDEGLLPLPLPLGINEWYHRYLPEGQCSYSMIMTLSALIMPNPTILHSLFLFTIDKPNYHVTPPISLQSAPPFTLKLLSNPCSLSPHVPQAFPFPFNSIHCFTIVGGDATHPITFCHVR